MSADPSTFHAWENFYVMTGSAAAALTGLVFVVTTLVAQRPPAVRKSSANPTEGTKTFTSPTIVHFCAAFFVSGVLTAPWHKVGYPEMLLGLAGLAGVGYSSYIARRMWRMQTYRADIEEWIWYVTLPLFAYALIAGASIGLLFGPEQMLFGIAGATMLLIFVGIHNAWDVVTYLAIADPDE
jgi:hypothetical protein